ncbi:hypothetical protein [Streptomyces sp. 891-h]|nr:hypothetical protein [Streptomyces sp. 891-h]UNZ20240.1 hypothetical protein HC362_27480 [Streptomyces sp. 891-h]
MRSRLGTRPVRAVPAADAAAALTAPATALAADATALTTDTAPFTD